MRMSASAVNARVPIANETAAARTGPPMNCASSAFTPGWTYDSHILWHESYPLLALAGDRTSTLRLGHCVTNPGIRDPTVTASYYATLHEITDGRAVLGI